MDLEKYNKYVSLYENGVSIYGHLCDDVLKSKSIYSQEFYLLLLGILDSMDTLSILAKNTKTRDCYVISRMVYESIVNVMYILATDFEAMDEMIKYTLDKTQFESARSTSTDSETVFMVFDGEKHMVGFSGNNPIKMDGDPREWTKNNISKRHNAINKKFGKNATRPLQLAQLVIYRVSSDIAHGTLYGMKHTMGLIHGKKFKDFNANHMVNHGLGVLTSLLMVVTQALYPLISTLARELKLDHFEKEFMEHLIKMLDSGKQIVGDKDTHEFDLKKD